MQSLNEVKSEATLNMLRGLQPDLVLSVRYGKIFGNDFVRIPRYGVINLHSGLLPAYRGVLATFRALMHGDDTIGCTLHYIEDSSIDTGGIIGFAPIAVQAERSLLWHILALYPAAAPLLLDTIRRIDAGERPEIQQQPTEGAAYYSFPDAAELDAFTDKGWQVTAFDELRELYGRYVSG